MTATTIYYASTTHRRRDGVRIGACPNDAEYLRREHNYQIFAHTVKA